MSLRPSPSLSRRSLLRGAGAGLLPILSSACPAAPATGDWPCFRGPNHNGVLEVPLTLRAGGPVKLWEVEAGRGNASMAVVQGRLYTFGSGMGSNLVCLDAATGRPIWSRRVETHYGESTPSVENGRLYLLASFGSPSRMPPVAYCCDAATGNVLWKRELPVSTGAREYGHAGSPRLWEDLVILNAGGGAALKKATGEVVWAHQGFPGLATPVVSHLQGRPCAALFGGDRLIVREARSGRELWQIPWKTELAVNACDPIVFDNKIFLCSEYGRGRALYDLGGSQPRTLWEYGQGRGSSFSSGFYHGGTLYCFAENGFNCLDAATGQSRWREPGGVSALLIGGTIIVSHSNGGLQFGRISPAGFKTLTTIEAGFRDVKAVPAYAAGRLYLRNEHGRIACFQIGAPA